MTPLRDYFIGALRRVHFRGKRRVLDALAAPRGERLARVDGVLMRLDLSDMIQRDIYLGCYELPDLRAIARYLHPGATVFDVGANVGPYTFAAVNRIGASGRVFAFEPSPAVRAKLETGVRENALSNVTVLAYGLSDSTGKANLYIPPYASGNHSPTMIHDRGGEKLVVDVTTIDTVMAERAIDCVDLLKIDVEGYEERVLRGAARAFAERRVRAVLCEFNPIWLKLAGSSPRRLQEILEKAGFTDVTPARGYNRFFVLRDLAPQVHVNGR